jgi:phosphoribosyl 1,2-cyclic phosphodiesterase
MLQLCSLASGSSGNCIYIGSDIAHLLIDVGLSGKKIKEGLDSISIDPKNLHAILITHEHFDHISGLGVMSRRYKIPLFLTQKTWYAIKKQDKIGCIDESLIHIIEPDKSFMIHDLFITPFKTSHDAAESVCFTINHALGKIGFATDLGVYNDYILNYLYDCTILYIEANHDIKMLEAGSYPYYLKQRILSDLGHLSNELSTKLISDVIHDQLKYIVLAHLSNENNHPDIAYLEVRNLLDYYYQNKFKHIELSVAKRDTYSKPVILY